METIKATTRVALLPVAQQPPYLATLIEGEVRPTEAGPCGDARAASCSDRSVEAGPTLIAPRPPAAGGGAGGAAAAGPGTRCAALRAGRVRAALRGGALRRGLAGGCRRARHRQRAEGARCRRSQGALSFESRLAQCWHSMYTLWLRRRPASFSCSCSCCCSCSCSCCCCCSCAGKSASAPRTPKLAHLPRRAPTPRGTELAWPCRLPPRART